MKGRRSRDGGEIERRSRKLKQEVKCETNKEFEDAENSFSGENQATIYICVDLRGRDGRGKVAQIRLPSPPASPSIHNYLF